MSAVHIVITGCAKHEFVSFQKRKQEFSKVKCTEDDAELHCELPPELLEPMFDELKAEAMRGWSQKPRRGVLAFDNAFFPASTTQMQPVRQLRGLLAARLARQKENLPPACCTPGLIFGTKRKSARAVTTK